MSTGPQPEEREISTASVVGARLRAARIKAGMTQAEVSERSGLSLSFVRLVESGKSDISLSRVLRWTTLFGLPVADLFTDPQADEVVVIRPEDRVEVPSRESGVRFLLLSPGGDHDLEPAIFELASGWAMQRALTHEGEETVFVLRGRVRLWVGDHDLLLTEGDSAYYRSQLAHRFGNAGRSPASLLVTTTHPRLHPRIWAALPSGEPVSPTSVDRTAESSQRSTRSSRGGTR